MMPVLLKKQFELHARLAGFQRRLSAARQRIADWLPRVQNPYIAFSGGKDSTCILSLVREQRPQTHAVYIDADCAFPEISQLLAVTPNLIKIPASEPFLDTLARFGLDNTELEKETMRTTVYQPIKSLITEFGFDGVCYGLRAEESYGRRKHAQAHGAIFRYKRDGLWGCQPIYDWEYEDVWAFIVSRNLPYAGTYDKLWDAPKEDQRVSYWAGETKRRWGRFAWLKRNYPDLFNQLAVRIPEVRAYV